MSARRVVSLGLSCQTRFASDLVQEKQPTLPFDWLISTRPGLLGALRSEGKTLWPDRAALGVYDPEGAPHSGIWGHGLIFWHDYPLDQRYSVIPNWPDWVEDVRRKYQRRWERFRRLLRDAGSEKVLVVSNAQADLDQFPIPGASFDEAFALTADFASELVSALRDLGGRKFELGFVCRRSGEAATLTQLGEVDGVRIRARYVDCQHTEPTRFVAEAMLEPLRSDAADEVARYLTMGPRAAAPTPTEPTAASVCNGELLARGRANDWDQARRERLRPEAWPTARSTFRFPPGAKVFTIGSCFAREIETHLGYLGCEVPTLGYNAPRSEVRASRPTWPFNKYTPADVVQEVAWASSIYGRDDEPREDDSSRFAYEDRQGGWLDVALAGCRLGVDRERFFERRREIYRIWREVFQADCVIITLGLTEAWFDRETGCSLIAPPFFAEPKGDLARFELRILDYAESLTLTQRAIDLIRLYNPRARFLLTTSPVPLEMSFSEEDVLIANTLSKSTLRTVCGAIVESNEGVDYFPSYENVMLTRSWDIWRDDQHEVAPFFVGKIVARMAEAYFGEIGRARVLTQLAFAALDDLDPERARQLAIEACGLDAGIADAWLARSEANRRLGRAEETREAADRAAALRPDSCDIRRHQGEALLTLGLAEEALAVTRILLGLEPEDPRSLFLLGQVSQQLGDLEEAEAALRKAFDLQPETPQYGFALVGLLRQVGKAVESVELEGRLFDRFRGGFRERMDLIGNLVAADCFEQAERRIEQGLRVAGDEDERRRLEDARRDLQASSVPRTENSKTPWQSTSVRIAAPRLPGIDRVYCINLDRRTERWSAMRRQFADLGLEVTRFPGLEAEGEQPNRIEMRPGQLGCLRSHRAVIEDARERGLQAVLVLEDDLVLSPRFVPRLTESLRVVPEDWETLYLAGTIFDQADEPVAIGGGIFRNVRTFGTMAIVVRNTVFDDLIDLYASGEYKADDCHALGMQPRGHSYITIPFLAHIARGPSDVAEEGRTPDHIVAAVRQYYRAG